MLDIPKMLETYNDQFTESSWAHYIISRVDSSKDRDHNIAIVLDTKIKRDPLKAVIKFLKTFTEHYPEAVEQLVFDKSSPNKDEMINKIINFVELSKPHFCKKCETEYSPYTKENVVRLDAGQLVKCYLCSLPAHGTCIKDDIINSDLGIVYLCQICYENKGGDVSTSVKEDKTPPDTTHKTVTEPSSSSDDSSTTNQSENEASKKKKKLSKKKSSSKSRHIAPDDSRQQDDQRSHHREFNYPPPHDSRQRQPQHRGRRHSDDSDSSEISDDSSRKNQRMCSYFKRGICRHGISGKSGGTCSFIHRKVCRAYQLYGSDKRMGCQKKENCEYWHPPMCYKSLNERRCFDDKCRFWHLKGTLRYPEDNSAEAEAIPIPNTNNQTQGDFLGQMKSQMQLEIQNMMRQQQQQMMQQMNQQFMQMMARLNQQVQVAQPNQQVQHNPLVQQVYQPHHLMQPQPQLQVRPS